MSLQLQNFRNYDTASIEFGGGVNLLLGDNAQGKTSLLEAVYLCSVGRSPRTTKDRELIKTGCNTARIKVNLQATQQNRDTIEIVVDSSVNKRVAINSMPLLRLGELMGVCNCVLFSPDEMSIVKDGPSERRKFVDIALCQLSKAYFYMLQNYNKVLQQRNKLLKRGRATESELYIWDNQLVDIGAKIIKTRRGFVSRLAEFAACRHSDLSDSKEELLVSYQGIDSNDLTAIRQQYLEQLTKDRERDTRHGYTHSGPHKDDLSLVVNGIDVRTYGSQGQQRSVALSLKLAQADLITQHSGQTPILLLDDVLSELDNNRCKKLLQFCNTMQTIITATHIQQDLLHYVQQAKTFVIKNGNAS